MSFVAWRRRDVKDWLWLLFGLSAAIGLSADMGFGSGAGGGGTKSAARLAGVLGEYVGEVVSLASFAVEVELQEASLATGDSGVAGSAIRDGSLGGVDIKDDGRVPSSAGGSNNPAAFMSPFLCSLSLSSSSARATELDEDCRDRPATDAIPTIDPERAFL